MTIQRDFGKRLQACMKQGNLRVADLARWFDRPHATVRGWVLKGIQPAGGPHDLADIERMLLAMEHMIKARKGFPLEPGFTPRNRKQYVLKAATEVRGQR